MKFVSFTNIQIDNNTCERDYNSSDKIQNITFGRHAVYFKKLWKVIYIPYKDIDRVFRRVVQVPMKICCGKGTIDIQYVVFEKKGKELLQLHISNKETAIKLIEQAKSMNQILK